MSITGTGNFNTHYTLESSCLLSSIVPSTHVSLCITSIHTNSKQQNIIQNNRRHLSCNKVRFKPGSAHDCVLYYERRYVMYIEHSLDWMRGLVWRAPSVLVFQVHTLVCTPSTTSPQWALDLEDIFCTVSVRSGPNRRAYPRVQNLISELYYSLQFLRILITMCE